MERLIRSYVFLTAFAVLASSGQAQATGTIPVGLGDRVKEITERKALDPTAVGMVTSCEVIEAEAKRRGRTVLPCPAKSKPRKD